MFGGTHNCVPPPGRLPWLDAGPIHTFIPPAGTVQTAILPSLFHPGFTAHSDRQVSSSAGKPGAQ